MKPFQDKSLQKNHRGLLANFFIVAGFALALYLILDLFEIKSINFLFLVHLGLCAIGSFFLGIVILPKRE